MNKLITIFALTLLSLSGISCSLASKALFKSLAMVRVTDRAENPLGNGTAFAVDKNLLLTANHVCDAIDSLPKELISNIWYFDGEKINESNNIAIVKRDSFNDLCLIKTFNINLKTLKISNSPSPMGDKIYSYGCAQGIFGFLSDGFVIDNYFPIDEKRKVLMVSAPAYFGQSGGPILNGDGEVIGVTTNVFGEFHHIQISPTTDVIRKFVQEYQEH